MKHFYAIIFTVVVCVSMSSCTAVSIIKDATTVYEAAAELNDGTMVEGRIHGGNFASGAKKVAIKSDKKKYKIASKDIAVLYLWRKDYPDRKNALVYRDYKYVYKWRGTTRSRDMKPAWMSIEAAGEDLLICGRGKWYGVDKKGGALTITYDRDYGIQYVAAKSGAEYMEYIGSSRTSEKNMRARLLEYLIADPILCEKLESGEVKATDFDDVADKYRPVHK